MIAALFAIDHGGAARWAAPLLLCASVACASEAPEMTPRSLPRSSSSLKPKSLGPAVGTKHRADLPKQVANAPSAQPPSGAANAQAATPAPPKPLPQRRADMLLVPAGSFKMGALEQGEGERDEHPAHAVTLPAFYLDETEVTNQAYAEAVAAGVCVAPYPRSAVANGFGRDKRFRKPRQPVSSISWDNAHAYCQWRNKRLPSEAEWERAARGDDNRRYVWGDQKPDRQFAQYNTSITAEVGSHPAGKGPFGHLDLAGNVWEWVEDIYDPYAYRREAAARGTPPVCKQALAAQKELRDRKMQGFTGSNPIPTTCERVLRGGAFNYFGSGLRASNRVHHPARYRLVMSGFRCAQDIEPAKPDSATSESATSESATSESATSESAPPESAKPAAKR